VGFVSVYLLFSRATFISIYFSLVYLILFHFSLLYFGRFEHTLSGLMVRVVPVSAPIGTFINFLFVFFYIFRSTVTKVTDTFVGIDCRLFSEKWFAKSVMFFRSFSWSVNETKPIVYVYCLSVYAVTQEDGRITVRDVIPGCSELIISRVQVSDVGLYECRSVNRVGTQTRSAAVDVGCEPLLKSNHHAANIPSLSDSRVVD